MSVELNDITSGYSTGLINDNFQLVEDELNNNVLRRDGLSSGEANHMEVGLDMNSNFVYNLPEPVLEHQAARLQDVQNAIAGSDSANLITFTPYKSISAGNVQAAIQQVVDQASKDFDTISDMDAFTDFVVGQVVRTHGYLSIGDGGGNTYEIVAAGTSTDDGGSFIDLSGSGLQAKGLFPEGQVFPEQFGAIGDGVADATSALNTSATFAASSNLLVRWPNLYKVLDQVNLGYTGLRVIGNDRTESGLIVESDFNLAATGVITFGTTQPAPTLEDVGIFFEQDDTETVRANIIQYPPAILAKDCPRFNLKNIRIEKGVIGVDASGNSGGAHIDNAEIGCLQLGIKFDGALDFIFLDAIQFWPFGFAGTNLYNSIYSDGTTRGMSLTGVDGVSASSIGSFRAEILINDSFGNIGILNCDGRYADLQCLGGSKISIGAFYSTTDAADDRAITVGGTNTRLSIGAAWLENATDLTGSSGLVIVEGTGSRLLIGQLSALTSGATTRLLFMPSPTTSTTMLSNVHYIPPTGVNMTNNPITVQTGKLEINGMRVADKVSGTGNIIGIQSNARHVLTDITAPGWGVSLPADTSLITTHNINVSANVIQNRYVGGQRQYYLTGTLDGSGNVSIAHGLTSPQTQVIDIHAIRNNGSARFGVNAGNLAIDGTNVIVTTSDAGKSGHTVEVYFTLSVSS